MQQSVSLPPAPARKSGRKAFWLKQAYLWHWVSSAISLVGLLLFAITGITLNHAAEIEAAPVVQTGTAALPAPLRSAIAPGDADDSGERPLPDEVAEWIQSEFKISPRGDAEWNADEVYLALPRPGGDGWVAIDRTSGDVTTEVTDRGWISWLNDLHKGRNAGGIWKWFIDIFSVACIVFALTGFVLLQIHARKRPSTWPLVVAGIVIPAVLAVFFIH